MGMAVLKNTVGTYNRAGGTCQNLGAKGSKSWCVIAHPCALGSFVPEEGLFLSVNGNFMGVETK